MAKIRLICHAGLECGQAHGALGNPMGKSIGEIECNHTPKAQSFAEGHVCSAMEAAILSHAMKSVTSYMVSAGTLPTKVLLIAGTHEDKVYVYGVAKFHGEVVPPEGCPFTVEAARAQKLMIGRYTLEDGLDTEIWGPEVEGAMLLDKANMILRQYKRVVVTIHEYREKAQEAALKQAQQISQAAKEPNKPLIIHPGVGNA